MTQHHSSIFLSHEVGVVQSTSPLFFLFKVCIWIILISIERGNFCCRTKATGNGPAKLVRTKSPTSQPLTNSQASNKIGWSFSLLVSSFCCCQHRSAVPWQHLQTSWFTRSHCIGSRQDLPQSVLAVLVQDIGRFFTVEYCLPPSNGWPDGEVEPVFGDLYIWGVLLVTNPLAGSVGYLWLNGGTIPRTIPAFACPLMKLCMAKNLFLCF